MVHPLLITLDLAAASTLLNLFFTGILLSGIFAVSRGPRVFRAALALGALGLVASFTLELADNVVLQAARQLLLAAFFGLVAGTILRYVLERSPVTADKIFGALCVYLLLGMIWASVYSALHQLQPQAFSGPLAEYSDYMYYSFVTLTTLGYGDVTPRLALSQSLSTLEAVMGQIYLAVLVARLVGLHIVSSGESE